MFTKEQHIQFLRRAIEVSKNARAHGNTPFGAILVDGDGNILMEQENIEITERISTGHAEATLAAVLLMNIQRNFYGIVHYIRRQSLALCVLEQFTGQI